MLTKPLIFLFLMTLASAVWADTQSSPLAKFVGVWTLQDQRWTQRWDGQTTETIEIQDHITRCRMLNTKQSVLCEVSSPDLRGHILWTYDPIRKRVNHLSSFGDIRIGVGEGSTDANGNLELKVSFASEGPNVVRHYVYKWLNDNQYSLHSAQFDDGVETSNFYAGNFQRLVSE